MRWAALVLFVASSAAAGTPRVRAIRVNVIAREPKPVVITIDDRVPVVPVVLRKLPSTPAPRCTKDRRGSVVCVIAH
jgi:hypothetical protein